jgi:hypothetical protein
MTRAPEVEAIRLSTRATRLSAPPPPLGLRAWDPEAAAMAVWLDATASDLTTVRDLVEQIADARTLQPRTAVIVLATAGRTPSGWRRVLGAQRVAVPVELRCSALLARGYVEIGADADLAWGWSSAG